MTKTANAEKLQKYKSMFSLTVDQILAFASSPSIVRVVKNICLQISNILRDNLLRYWILSFR